MSTVNDQALNINTDANRFFRRDKPVFTKRAVHFDLKGLPPHPDRLMQWLHIAAAGRYNVVLVEWEDTFPWEFDQRVRGELYYSPQTIRAFHAEAQSLGIEVIPLIQSLGHLEMVLRLPGYDHLRELPERGDAINPLADGAREIVRTMMDEVLAITPDVSHFHLGGDEAWRFGSHPDTKSFIDTHGKAELYLHHCKPLLDRLIEKNIRPILWHDMMYDWEMDALKEIAGLADLMAWGYQGHPDTTDTHFAVRHLQRMIDAGVSVWGSTAFKGGDGFDLDIPDPGARRINAAGWAEVGQRLGFKGLITTGWSRYSSDDIQCYPFDGALDVLMEQGVLMHDGETREGCLQLLAGTDDLQRFESIHPVLKAFQYRRTVAWNLIRQAVMHHATKSVDPRRDTRWLADHHLENAQKQMEILSSITPDVIRLLEASTPTSFARHYVNERIVPLEHELARLDKVGEA